MSDPITQVTFQNAGVLTLEGGFTTFGQTFQAGDLMPGQQLLAEIGGQLVAVQVDVRNTYPDGSVKMAVLTMERPALSPWQEATATLLTSDAAAVATPVSLAQVLSGHSASLTLAIEDGRPPLAIDIGAAVTQALADGTASFWQQGPYATQARIEIPIDNSSMRVVLDVTGYADGEIRFTVGLNNDRAMEAVGGHLNYVATVTLDGETLFRQGLSHAQYQRVSLDFASNEAHGIQGLGAPQEGWLNIKHDIDYLKSTGAIFQYNTEFVADPGRLRSYYDQVANNPQWGQIFWAHGVHPFMGDAGGRPDIGYTTGANTHWLLSQDAAAAGYAMGQAKVAGYVPWNFYDMANGTVLNTDNYPKVWTDARGGTGSPGDPNSTGLTQQVPSIGWGPDTAHQPDLSFIPYILTGERWMYDNVMTQASHSIHSTWYAQRNGDSALVVQNNQMRASAWSMRQIDNAAWVAEDGSAEQIYFQQKVQDNWSWILSNVDAWTETWGEISGFIPSSAYVGLPPPWQTYMLASVVALSALRGSDEARDVLEFMSNFLLGMALSGDQGFDPHNAVIRSLVVPKGDTRPTTWEALADALKANGIYADGQFVNTELEYQRIYIGALTMAYEATGDERFREAAEVFMRLDPPGLITGSYMRNSQYAVTLPDLHAQHQDDPTYVTKDHNPISIEIGTGPDEIRLMISQDYFNGSAQYRVFVDGKQVGDTLTASALKALAQADTVIIRGDFGDTITVRVQMINDAAATGSTTRDRNLYVNAITYNGEDLPIRAYLPNNVAQDFVFTADGTLISPPPLVKPEPNAIPIPTIDPLPPKTVTLGDGPDEVILQINQDWYLGSAKYVVLVNGVRVGDEQEASAFRSAGETDTVIVRGNFSDGPVTLTVRYTNDKTDGYGLDRNLFIQSAEYNGKNIPISPAGNLMYQNQVATMYFDMPDLSPKTVTIGTGPDELVFKVNQNYWKGKSEYVVLVDGQQYGDRQKVNALLANGEYDTVIVRGSFPEGTTIGLRFMNDAQGSPTEGRDIFVHAVTMNGEALALSRNNLLTTGHTAVATAGVFAPDVQAPAPAPTPEPQPEPAPTPPPSSGEPVTTPKTVTIGDGSDELVFKVNQNYWKGAAEYIVLVDGQQYGDRHKVGALLANGEYDTVIVRGSFPEGTQISLRFMNDAHEGPNMGRDIFVHAVSMNGELLAQSRQNLWSTGQMSTVTVGVLAPETAPTAPPLPKVPTDASVEAITPKTIELGEGPDQVVVHLNQDWYLGAAQYMVLIDGVQFGDVQTAAALRTKGETDTLILRSDFTTETTIGIRFVNDAYYGHLNDRNLFIQSVEVNGVKASVDQNNLLLTGHTATVDLSAASHTLSPPQPEPQPEPAPTPPPSSGEPVTTPKTVTIGDGSDELVFKVNQNYWKGAAEYIVLVDGQQYGDRHKVGALLANGEYDTVIVRGSFPEGTQISLRFMNDAHEGPNMGRDIFVHAVSMNGELLAQSRQNLWSTGQMSTVTVGVLAPETAPTAPPLPKVPTDASVEAITPKTIELGEGPDQVVVHLNQDWYLGAAQYMVLIDGVQFGDVQTAAALRTKGETDTLILRSDFTTETTIGIRFVNDAYYGHLNDRNLFIQSVEVNGVKASVDQNNLLLTGHTATVDLSAASHTLSPPQPEPQPPSRITVGSGNDTLVFGFTIDGASTGTVGITANGISVFQGNLSDQNYPGEVAVQFDTGGSVKFTIWFEDVDAAELSSVTYNGINLTPLSHDLTGWGITGFAFHTAPLGTGVKGSNDWDVFILAGGSASVTTGGGRDLVVVRDPGTYKIMDFDPQNDRILFEGMSRESLSVTTQAEHLVLGFPDGSVTLHKGAKFDVDMISIYG